MSSEEQRMINDPIHGHIVLDPLLWKFIDTPEFQRLRNIKQLGCTYYVYPGGSHNRFEHSIGVCYLAGKMVETLREKQPELGITDEEVLCVQIAGLCHDLGHGPFSHVFEQVFIPEVCPADIKWKHEDASVAMFHHMLEKNQQLHDEFSIKERKFITELIAGKPDKDPPEEWKIKKRFLYEIVANNNNGIDVDKWDYFARDSHSLGVPTNFNMWRTMQLVRVIKCKREGAEHNECSEGTTHICMRDNEVYNLYEMFHTRYSLHKRVYQHKVVKGVELMITDAFVAANDYLTFHDKTMSEAIDDMDAYIQLTDEVFYRILHSTGSEMKKARGILQRLQKRDLYKCIIDEPCDDWKRDSVPKGQQLCKEIFDAVPDETLPSDRIHVLVTDMNYGMKAKNPIDHVLFYKKEDPSETFPIPKEKVSPVLPETFQECRIRVYVKDLHLEEKAKACFKEWWDKQDKELKDKDKVKKLTEEVEKLQQRLNEKEHTESHDGTRI